MKNLTEVSGSPEAKGASPTTPALTEQNQVYRLITQLRFFQSNNAAVIQ